MLSTSQAILEKAGIQTARLDTLAIYQHVLKADKSKVLAGLAEPSKQQQKTIDNLISRRAKRVPLAYLLHSKEFYGRDFCVTNDVLIPRPESEDLIALALELKLPRPFVTDVGCGSGILGITYALETSPKNSKNWLSLCDISQAALQVAKRNAGAFNVKAQFYCSDLISQVSSHCDGLVFANLPYVPDKLVTSAEIESEPALALFSGPDGLNHYRKFWKQVSNLDQPRLPSHVITESLPQQFRQLDQLAADAGYQLVSQAGLGRCYQQVNL